MKTYIGWYIRILDNLGDVVRFVGRTAEAKGLYEESLDLAERELQNTKLLDHRTARIHAIRRRGLIFRDLGNFAASAADFRQALRTCDHLPAAQIYEFETACCHGALASLAGRPNSGVTAAEAEVESESAIKSLRNAISHGYRNVNEFRIEPAFDSLRDRNDFKKLIADLEPEKSPAQPGLKP
jgi:tetratricopeptide (TPR) repeat protein